MNRESERGLFPGPEAAPHDPARLSIPSSRMMAQETVIEHPGERVKTRQIEAGRARHVCSGPMPALREP